MDLRHQWLRPAATLVGPILILGFWSTGSYVGWWPNAVIAPPAAVIRALWRLATSGQLALHTAASSGRLIGGSLLGVFTGISTASIVALVPAVGRIVRPTFDFLAPIPVLAWIPLFIVMLGIDGARIALIATGTGFILYSSTSTVIADTKVEYIDLARLYKKNRLQLLMRISLPSGAWVLFGSLRTALGLSWVLLLASELIASSSGLGWLIWDSRNFSRADEMMAGMIWVGLLGFILDRLVAAIQNRTTSWRPTFQGI
jgi:sulfonate transport system permease protein